MPPRPPLVVTVGDLVEDVVVVLDESEPTVGLTPADDRLTLARGTDTHATITRRRGGSAANVAVAVVAAGGRARFVGNVGADRLGDQLLANLAADGVEPLVTREGNCGSIVVLIEAGERTFLSDRGVATNLVSAPEGALDGAAWLHLPAYCLAEGPLALTAHDLARAAVAHDVRVSVDASSIAQLASTGADAFLRWCADVGVEVLFANGDEAAYLALPEAALAVGISVVISHDAEGATAVTRAGSCSEAAAALDGVVDPSGAGDAFAAGYLVAAAGGADAIAALQSGHIAARRLLESRGARARIGS